MRSHMAMLVVSVLSFILSGCFVRPHPDTPLTIAAEAGDVADLRALLASGTSPDARDGRGLTALIWAARYGQVEAVNVLLDAGADVDGRDTYVNGWTAMIHAVHKGQTRIVLTLLERGARPDAASPNGCTPLLMAAGEGNLEVVTALLERGADPGRETVDHANALTNAVAGGHTEIVRLLLSRAPDLKVSNTLEGAASVLFARLRGKREILRLLRESRALHSAEEAGAAPATGSSPG